MAFDTAGPGSDVVEVLPRGAEAGTRAADRRAVDRPVDRLAAVRLLSDAVVVLPGGIDVLADLLTLLTEQALGLNDKPFGVLDPAGLLDPLAEQLDALDRAGLPAAPLLRAGNPAELLDALEAWRPNGGGDVRAESVPLLPERLHPVAALMVPDADGGWRRVSCYRVDGPQPVVPGAVSHPLGETAACEPAAAALQDLLRRGRIP